MSKQHHYVYRVDFLEVPNIYFGSRTCKCLPEKDTKYLGSPVTFKEYWELYTPIKTILVIGFEDRFAANAYEKELILEQWEKDVALSLNASVGGEKFTNVGRPGPMTGKPGYWKDKKMPEESRLKIVEACKLRDEEYYKNTHTPEWYRKVSEKRGINHGNYGRRHTPEEIQKMSDAKKGQLPSNILTYAAISPTGELIVFENARQFIRDNPDWDFDASCISGCAKGKYKHHRGWRFFYLEDYELIKDKIDPMSTHNYTKSYVGISPTDDRVFFTNARKFCRENPELDFKHSSISACAKGNKASYKGWKFYYEEDYKASLGLDQVCLQLSPKVPK